MKNKLLADRRNHFQWVFEQLNTVNRAWYLEKDWFDTPTLISKEDAKREVVQIEKLLNKLERRRGWTFKS